MPAVRLDHEAMLKLIHSMGIEANIDIVGAGFSDP
jgi:hypothetical protein